MVHLPVFISLLSLLIGVGALLLAFQRWRQETRGPWGHLFRFLLFYNGMLLVGWIAQYACLNILGCGEAMTAVASTRWFSRLGFVLALGMQQAMGDVAVGVALTRHVRIVRVTGWGLAVTVALMVLVPGLPRLPVSPMRIYYWVMLTAVSGLAVGTVLRKKPCTHSRFFPLLILYVGVMLSQFLSKGLPTLWRECLITLSGVILNGGMLMGLASPHRSRATHPEEASKDLPARLDTLGLSAREAEIARLVLAGLSNKEIEAKLCISHHTVKNHLYRMYQRVGVNSRAQFMHRLHGQTGQEWNG